MSFAFSVINDKLIEAYGDTFIIGVTPRSLKGMWNEAEIGRVQQYFSDDELKLPIYEISFPSNALGAPWYIRNGVEVKHALLRWKLVLRKVSAPGEADQIGFVHVIGNIIPR